MKEYQYTCLLFKQRDDSAPLLTFYAPVGEIKTWAGVPRKHFNYQHGFQRSLLPNRVDALAEYFEEDNQNITPTSIVIALRKNAFVLENMTETQTVEDLRKIKFSIESYEEKATLELISEAIVLLEQRLPQDVVEQIRINTESALQASLEAADQENNEVEVEQNGKVIEDLDIPTKSHLADFYAVLVATQKGLSEIENEDELREVLYSLLKPATIVDGQHRVYGAADIDETIKFSVCAIPDTEWLEQVFQFVVINQKARSIQPAFLNAIIATSLTEDEIKELYRRLKKSGVDVDKAQIMMKINTDEDSPFKNMIDFEIEGAIGFLKFPGMSALVKDFKAIPTNRSVLLKPESSWEENWLIHFYKFWWGIRDYFMEQDKRLWDEPSASNPNNLLMIVTLQEMQKLVLEMWADSRLLILDDPQKTYDNAKLFRNEFPSTFFTDDWKIKSLQTSVGRSILSRAMQETRRNVNRKSWGHRRLGLFKGE